MKSHDIVTSGCIVAVSRYNVDFIHKVASFLGQRHYRNFIFFQENMSFISSALFLKFPEKDEL